MKARLVYVKLTRGRREKVALVAVPLDESEDDFLAYAKREHPKDKVTIEMWGVGMAEDGEPTIYISNMNSAILEL